MTNQHGSYRMKGNRSCTHLCMFVYLCIYVYGFVYCS